MGFYRDSARNDAVFAGGGLFWKPAGGLRLGGGLVLMRSDTYNDGDPFIAPAPVVAYEWRRVTQRRLLPEVPRHQLDQSARLLADNLALISGSRTFLK